MRQARRVKHWAAHPHPWASLRTQPSRPRWAATNPRPPRLATLRQRRAATSTFGTPQPNDPPAAAAETRAVWLVGTRARPRGGDRLASVGRTRRSWPPRDQRNGSNSQQRSPFLASSQTVWASQAHTGVPGGITRWGGKTLNNCYDYIINENPLAINATPARGPAPSPKSRSRAQQRPVTGSALGFARYRPGVRRTMIRFG